VFRKFGLGRNKLREIALRGEIPAHQGELVGGFPHEHDRSHCRHADPHPQRQMVGKTAVGVPSSKLKISIAQVLKDEVTSTASPSAKRKETELEIGLKYYAGQPVIEKIERVSTPGLRIYKGRDELPRIMNGLGVAIVSTSRAS